ncbi:hypothetical protein NDU88_004360 [Pleurodeles waltl]|uniref:Uncharacterized protein n=1 Tax=Pleurodeles waltl TaxID=8319 RepID=A0AAV7UF38_PLEWA|nr:hypothetical protein NDU88_004360 [Pleurodeles waltl]
MSLARRRRPKMQFKGWRPTPALQMRRVRATRPPGRTRIRAPAPGPRRRPEAPAVNMKESETYDLKIFGFTSGTRADVWVGSWAPGQRYNKPQTLWLRLAPE